METNKKRMTVIGAGVVAVAVLTALAIGARPRAGNGEAEKPAAAPVAVTASAPNDAGAVTPAGAAAPVVAPVPADVAVAAAQPLTADERAQVILRAGLGKSEGKAPAGDSTALNQFMASHDLAEKDLLARLSRAGETGPQALEALFAMRRRGASEAEMKAYARSNVHGIPARAIVFKWIDQQLGKPPVNLPPPGTRKGMELGSVEYKGPPR